MRSALKYLPGMAILVTLALNLLVSGCAPGTAMVDQWRDPNFGGSPVRNVMVFRAAKDPVRERIWEDAMVLQLGKEGVHAVPFYSLNPGGEAVDSAMVRAALVKGAFDRFLMIKRAGTREESYYVPGTTIRERAGTYRDPFWGTWRQVYRETTTPGYTETDLISSYDAYLYTTPGGDHNSMVWSGRIESRNPGTPSESSERAVKQVVGALKKAALL